MTVKPTQKPADKVEQKTAIKRQRPTKNPLVRRKEQAEELGISDTTHWRYVKKGIIPTQIRIGNIVGLPRSVFDQCKIDLGWPAPENKAES